MPKSSLDGLPYSSHDGPHDSLPDGLLENKPETLPEWILDTAQGPLIDADRTLPTLLEPTIDSRSDDQTKTIEESN